MFVKPKEPPRWSTAAPFEAQEKLPWPPPLHWPDDAVPPAARERSAWVRFWQALVVFTQLEALATRHAATRGYLHPW